MSNPATANDGTASSPIADEITNRQFVALVRAGLDAAGHRDIAIERSWIDEDEPGYPFLLNVPVGSELVVPLRPRDAFFRTEDASRAAEHARYFVQALVTLRRAERMLVKYASDVRRAAAKVIAEARAEGLDLLLADVGFKPTHAWHLSGSDWKEAAYHVLAEVKVRHTSFYLRPTVTCVYPDEPANVAKELGDIIDEERERLARIAYLDGLGADLIVDGITLDLFRAHDIDVVQVLREAWKSQHVSVPVQHDDNETSISVITSDGEVQSSIMLAEAFWNGEMLWLLGDNVANGIDVLGSTLADKVSHPVLASRKVVRVDSRPEHKGSPDTYHLDRSDRFLFDADTGRIWPLATRLAA